MSRLYYPLRYRFNHRDHSLIWYANENDGVVVDSDKQISVFRTRADLLAYAQIQGMALESGEDGLLNLDVVVEGLGRKRPVGLNCRDFLNAWNLLGDVANSVGGGFDRDKGLTQKIYGKLFWGNNLPALTPEGKHYEPIWSRREHQIMREVLSDGLRLFRAYVRLQSVHAEGEFERH